MNRTARGAAATAALLGLVAVAYGHLQPASSPGVPGGEPAGAGEPAERAGADMPGAGTEHERIGRELERALPAMARGLAAGDGRVQLPNGDWARRLPDGRLLVVTGQPAEPVRAGVVTAYEMLTQHPDTARTLQAGIRRSFDERQECLSAFIHRGGRITGYSEWVMVLTVEAGDGVATIQEVEVPPRTWPPEFDDQVKECYVKSFLGKTFPSDHGFHHVTEYPMCVNPPPGGPSEARAEPRAEPG